MSGNGGCVRGSGGLSLTFQDLVVVHNKVGPAESGTAEQGELDGEGSLSLPGERPELETKYKIS